MEIKEGQEFFIGGKRYVAKNGAPVQEEKRGPLGGELVRFGNLLENKQFWVLYNKTDCNYALSASTGKNNSFDPDSIVEINVPQQAKGRVMTAGEAARLPDIVGKRVAVRVELADVDFDTRDHYPLRLSGVERWLEASTKIEVLD